MNDRDMVKKRRVYTLLFSSMLEFHRKKYSLKIEISEEKFIHLEYLQGTFGELLEMGEDMEEENGLVIWLSKFIDKSIKKGDRLTIDQLNFLPQEALTKILQPILDTFAKGYFRGLDQKPAKMPDVLPPDSSMIAFLLEHTNETMETLKGLTWEMILALQEGIIWNIRDQSEEGRRNNKTIARMNAHRKALPDEEALRLTRELARRMDNNEIKFQQTKVVKNAK